MLSLLFQGMVPDNVLRRGEKKTDHFLSHFVEKVLLIFGGEILPKRLARLLVSEE